MEEHDVLSLISMETAEPKRKLSRSAGAVYIVLILLIISTISLANLLEMRLNIPRYYVQPPLYAAIAICGIWIYRKHYISYRYTLTDRMLAIERIAGGKTYVLLAAELTEIQIASTEIYKNTGKKHAINASLLPKKRSALIKHASNGVDRIYRICPSDAFLEALTNQLGIAHLNENG